MEKPPKPRSENSDRIPVDTSLDKGGEYDKRVRIPIDAEDIQEEHLQQTEVPPPIPNQPDENRAA